MTSGKPHRRTLIATIATVIVVTLFVILRVLWLPWISPSYAADMLATDDGIGLAFWVPSAASHGGVRVIKPMAISTNSFALLRPVAAFTLLDIVSHEPAHELVQVVPTLLEAHSAVGRMLGFLAAYRAEVALVDRAQRSDEVLTIASQSVIDNDIATAIALRVGGATGLNEVEPAVIRNLASAATPSMIVSASCVAAAGISNSSDLEAALSAALLRLQFSDRSACASALVTKVGGKARSSLEEAIKLESDPAQKKMLGAILYDLQKPAK